MGATIGYFTVVGPSLSFPSSFFTKLFMVPFSLSMPHAFSLQAFNIFATSPFTSRSFLYMAMI
jgi:hypothetical protein